MDELLDLDKAFKNIKGPGAKQNAFSNNLKKFGQDIEKEMQRLGNVSPKYQE
ncbi:MAG: hypothetical protein IKO19_05440 [Candidatus Riflebacteria bacterium]|nr:hypothetical protein [Candidatus Riflebacteria bacterium]